MTQPDEEAAAIERMTMNYPVTLERQPDALQDNETSDETE